jgi:hypothetical protein
MRFVNHSLIAAGVALACSCGSSKAPADLAMPLDMVMPVGDFSGPDIPPNAPFDIAGADGYIATSGPNVVSMIVDEGPGGGGGFNTAYISIQICAPGSTTICQTIDHIIVDTGSVGLHIFANQVSSTVLAALPNSQSSASQNMTECYTYASGFVYGSVRTADLTISGETAPAMPLLIMADPTFSGSVPASCSQSGQAVDSVQFLGGNGIMGVGLFNPDCGSACTSAATEGNPVYYSCPTAATCTPVGVPLADQLPNPVARFTTDNNGVLLELPAIADSGAASPSGSLIFGIGTQANNKIIHEQVYSASADGFGAFSTKLGARTYDGAFFDSGTSDLSFASDEIIECSGQSQPYYCPTGTQTLSAELRGDGASGKSGTVGFKVANISVLFDSSQSTTAFDDIADAEGLGAGTFDWGLPIFFGHRMFFAIDGASTPNGTGPYFGL